MESLVAFSKRAFPPTRNNSADSLKFVGSVVGVSFSFANCIQDILGERMVRIAKVQNVSLVLVELALVVVEGLLTWKYATNNLRMIPRLSVIKIINSAPIRIIYRISLPQCCHLSIAVPIVQVLARH